MRRVEREGGPRKVMEKREGWREEEGARQHRKDKAGIWREH